MGCRNNEQFEKFDNYGSVLIIFITVIAIAVSLLGIIVSIE